MQRTDVIKRTIAEVVADRKKQLSPGHVFAEAFAKDGFDTRVEYDVTITDTLTSSRRKPRYPSRNVLKVVDLSRDPQEFYWHESPPRPGDPVVDGADLRREAANHFHRSPIPPLCTTKTWVQVPDGLWDDPASFAEFINYRLVVRLCTAENVTILRGEGGLLNLPEITRITDPGPFGSTILSACNEVEQNGSTADGLIMNPADYYRLLGSGTLVRDLEENGVFIVRTRLVDAGEAIVGDFGHGALLFDSGRSMISFAEPPPGTFAEPGVALTAEIYERVVLNLPTCFYRVSL
ncbi:family 3 encapsulin nanocompartment shell protein [Micromonospora sp. DT233]|uniref:family 3 encapsulin nanocompartment shell protein n=1 Tax=Micromonospora sp. DT233 TaxID=3393432 RepID=UPI003CF7094C